MSKSMGEELVIAGKKQRLMPSVTLNELLRKRKQGDAGPVLLNVSLYNQVVVDGPVLLAQDVKLRGNSSSPCSLLFASDCRISTAKGYTLSFTELTLQGSNSEQLATISIDGTLLLDRCSFIDLNVIVSGKSSLSFTDCDISGAGRKHDSNLPFLDVNDGKIELHKTRMHHLPSGIHLRAGAVEAVRCGFTSVETVVSVGNGAKASFLECSMEGCVAPGRVQGIGTNVKLRTCKLKQCGAIRVREEGSAYIDACFFGEAVGSAVECHSGFARVRSCTFFRNDVSLQWDKQGDVEIEYCTFYGSKNCPMTQVLGLDRVAIKSNNFIESPEVCNKLDLLAVAMEDSFYGASDYERRIYLDVLVQRLKRSYMLEQQSSGNGVAERLKTSVITCVKLLPALTEMLLEALLEEPLLGVYVATGEDLLEGLTLDDVLRSWPRFHAPELFDKAINALDKAEDAGQIEWRLHEEWKTKLKELQLQRFGDAKHYKRKDYLNYMARIDPLGCWYFLRDEQSSDLRKKVLLTLLSNIPLTTAPPKWIAQWAQTALAESDLKASECPKQSSPLLLVWYQLLLDSCDVQNAQILQQHLKSNKASPLSPFDLELLRFEVESIVDSKSVLSSMSSTIAQACARFEGRGPLPPFLRRRYTGLKLESATLERVLRELSLFYVSWRAADCLNDKASTVIAILSQVFFPDATSCPTWLALSDTLNSPNNSQRRTTLAKCAMCLAPPERPWLEMKLSNCKEEHYYCVKCLRRSVCTSGNLWGKCPSPGCTAIVTRRDLELVGVSRTSVESILRNKVSEAMRKVDGWRSCSVPSCMGGSSKSDSTVFVCALCKALVSTQPQDTDPVIEMKLLQGIGPSDVARGDGVYRECYHCAAVFEKGDKCSSMKCGICQQEFNLTFGPEKLNQHFFEEEGIGGQRYVPKAEGLLWKLGIFEGLDRGKVMSEGEAEAVYSKADALLQKQFRSVV